MVAPSIVGFVTRADWGARPPKAVSRLITPNRGGVTVHYGGPRQDVAAHHQRCIQRVNQWQAFHMDEDKRDWSDLAYTGLFCDHGYAFAGRGAGVRTAANGTNPGNQNWYAVTWIGGQGEIPSDLAIAAGAWWVQQLRQHGGAGQGLNDHSAHKPTECAGNPIRERLHLFLPDGSVQPVPAPAPAPPHPQAPAFPLPAGWYFGPRSGPRESVSGYYSHRGDLQRWQRQMEHRGWPIGVDGLYGPNTADITTKFQREKGLTVDGKIGPQTWRTAWEAPVT